MKRLIPAFALIFGWALVVWGAATPATLTTLGAICAMSNAEAANQPPVAFEATVTYRRADETTLFVQDGDAGIYVWADPKFQMAPGDRVLIKGVAKESFHPIVVSDSVTVLRHGSLPRPAPLSYDELMQVKYDSRLVSLRGRVRSADIVASANQLTVHLRLEVDGGIVDAWVTNGDEKVANQLVDAEVEVLGVAGAAFDGKMQRTGVVLSIPSLSNIKILKPSETNPWTLPLSQMDEVFDDYRVKDLSRRVRIHGTITYFEPGIALVLQSGAKSLWVITRREEQLHIGREADVTGIPDVHSGFLAIEDGEVKESEMYAPIVPKPVTRKELTASKNIFDLVTIEGQVVTEIRENYQDQYVLIADGQVFSAVYRRPVVYTEPVVTPMKPVPLGSRVRVTGICTLENSNPFEREVPFDILMRTPDDIVVVANPSLLNIRNLVLVAGALLLLVIASLAWGGALRSKVRSATASLSARIEAEAALERRTAQLEQKRSRILEDINGSRPLAEILEEITELVSFMLNDAPCWCEVTDGARLGDCPPDAERLRVLVEEIPARSGAPLGKIFAAFDPEATPAAGNEALSVGAKLATLAIETRRLYSDLLHRSEFDLLTDIHNRFSLEKQLDARIEEARENAGIFGLIYVDLDGFKQVNDLYGHHVGDLFLQEVAERMKRQLRPQDLLARLGGDEFAVLLLKVRNRADVEEIAQRLEHCFDLPLTLEGHILQGAASFGIALYPEDSATKDGLLSAADAAMYAAKNNKRPIESTLDQSLAPELTSISHT
ncbi:MAG: GGDEF domain-containing protein [Terracidiphilus sp.]